MDDSTPALDDRPEPRWQPLTPLQRRVAGVLVEKAKTTPNAYPLTLNAIVTAGKQKSNRSPQMNLVPDDVEDVLDELRRMGAVGEITGAGRVAKYRHYLYDWLGVDKVEIAVMTELLLRGEQTVGELRSRASRMEPIADQASLRPILASLAEKGLVVSLTPEGRGQIVTHALYLPEEMARLERDYNRACGPASSPAPVSPAAPPPASPPAAAIPAPEPAASTTAPPSSASTPSAPPANADEVAQLRQEVARLRDELERLKKDVEDIWSNLT